MIVLWILLVVNTVFAATPPYGWWTPFNAAAAIGALALIIAEKATWLS